MRILHKALDIVIGTAVGLVILPLSWWVVMNAWHYVTWPPPDDYALVIGGIIGFIILIWHQPHKFLHTWLHENAHASVCLLLFVRVGSLEATDGQGGAVRHARVDPIRTMLILIAPYTLPMVIGPLLVLRYFCYPGYARIVISGLCVAAFFLHLCHLWLNLRFNTFGSETDISRVGHVLSFVLIASSLLLIAAATIAVISSDAPPAWWDELFDA